MLSVTPELDMRNRNTSTASAPTLRRSGSDAIPPPVCEVVRREGLASLVRQRTLNAPHMLVINTFIPTTTTLSHSRRRVFCQDPASMLDAATRTLRPPRSQHLQNVTSLWHAKHAPRHRTHAPQRTPRHQTEPKNRPLAKSENCTA